MPPKDVWENIQGSVDGLHQEYEARNSKSHENVQPERMAETLLDAQSAGEPQGPLALTRHGKGSAHARLAAGALGHGHKR